MLLRLVAVGSLVAAPLLLPPGVAGQGAAQRGTAIDSARLLRSLRGEQAAFERIRQRNLPWAPERGSGECDERIGRFCLTYGDDDDGEEWVPPPEAGEVVRARDLLIARLDSAALLLPGDAWVAGQRVRYLVEAGRTDAAVEASRQCAAGWWCAALAGFALHRAGRAAPADSAFAAALAQMPADERRRWNDLSMVLEGASLRAFSRAEGAERERFLARFWRVADPLLLVPGNDLRSEHYARHVWDGLQDRARSPEGLAWGFDLREIMLRYGLPSGYERVRPRVGSITSGSIITHYPNDDLPFLPPHDVLREEWDVDRERARAGYKLPGVRWFKRLDHQIAVFRRGDSALVVAAYELPADSLPAGTRIEAGLALLPEDGAPLVARRAAGGGRSGAIVGRVAPRPVLASVEAFAPEAGRAARARRGLLLAPLVPGVVGVSDLLLLAAPDPLPDSLTAAVAAARGSARVRPGDRFGVYWEVYGLERGPETLLMSLRLVGTGGGWLRRAAERIGLAEEVAPIRLRWQERSDGRLTFPRSMALQVPEVPPGTYSLELSITVPGRAPLQAARTLEVVE